jgi:hypothetical protein
VSSGHYTGDDYAIAQLRADLERVTAERDENADARDMARRGWSETKAERDETLAALELEHNRCCNAIGEREVARAELAHLQRAWALHVLENQGTPSERWLSRVPESVAALIRAGAGCSTGACYRCKQRSALVNYSDVRGNVSVCAPGWGCSP